LPYFDPSSIPFCEIAGRTNKRDNAVNRMVLRAFVFMPVNIYLV